MTLSLRYAARSDVGLLREGNEDSLYAGPRLLAIADGMGGHAGGEVASAIAIASVARLDEDAAGADLLDALRRAVEDANARLRETVAGDGALEGMGTTLTALLAAGSRLGLLHIGDSRAYLLRDGGLTQITHDHTLVQALVDEGRITAEEAGSHPQRSMMLRALDGRSVEPDLSIREARRGDRYLLCSDGLSGVVSEPTISDALLLPDRQAAVDRLVDLALRGGGPDNISAIVADVVDEGSAATEPVIVDGAAAADPGVSVPSADTAAGRAALASNGSSRRRMRAEQPTARQPAPRRWWPVLGPVLLVLLLAVAAGAAALYVRSQFYVGADGGEVAIFQGVGLSVAGWQLSGVHERLGVPVGELPPYMQQQVRNGIPAASLGEARRIAGRLRDSQAVNCSTMVPTSPAPPTLTPTPSAAPTMRAAVPTPSATGSPCPASAP